MAEESQRIVHSAKRRFRRHNAGRRWVEGEIWAAMAHSWREGGVSGGDVKEGDTLITEAITPQKAGQPMGGPGMRRVL